MLSNFSQVTKILSPKNKKMALYAILLASISGLFDLVGISSILPFLSALSNPELIDNNKYLNYFYNFTNLQKNSFIIFLGIVSLVTIILNQLLRLYSNWYILYLSENLLYEKSRDLYLYYLIRPYKHFLRASTSHIVQKCTNYVNATVAGYMTPFLLIIAQSFTLIFLLAFLIYYKPILTLGLISFLSLFYLIIFANLKKKITSIGKATPNFYKYTSKVVTDTFETYKEFKLNSNKNYFLKNFEKPAERYKDSNVIINLIQQLPAFSLEIFAYALILALSLFLYFKLDNFSEIIPIIGILTLSMKRIMPATQSIYAQFSHISFYKASFEKIIKDLIKSVNFKKEFLVLKKKNNINFNRIVNIENISFSYQRKPVIKNLSVKILKNEFIGITGTSGHGKTTFLDFFCGLLKQKTGKFFIDGVELQESLLDSWQNLISYAPQKGYLINNTIVKNICYGGLRVDLKKIKKICKIVKLSEFIENELIDKYYTKIGENGVRLSGGQTQRVVLARALYSNPEILILDEATNAIDTVTENQILKNIRKEFRNITILFVTHRVNILLNADKIFFFQNGKIRSQGTYSELRKKDKNFNNLIKLNKSKKKTKNINGQHARSFTV